MNFKPLTKYFLPGLILYSTVAYYGASKEFEATLNLSETVTPLMLKEMFEAIISYILLNIIIIILVFDKS